MKPSVLIQLPTEPSYWGSSATPDDVDRILDSLESLVRSEFESRAEVEFERTPTPRSSGVHSQDFSLAADVHAWIQDHWTAAL